MSAPGFRYVTKAQFFAAVGPRNVHPRAERDRSVWIDQKTHAVVGITTPGYLCEGEESYSLSAALPHPTTGDSHAG